MMFINITDLTTLIFFSILISKNVFGGELFSYLYLCMLVLIFKPGLKSPDSESTSIIPEAYFKNVVSVNNIRTPRGFSIYQN